MTGMELLEAMLAGDLPTPPLSDLIGMRGVEGEEGRIVIELDPVPAHSNGAGTVHGGIVAALLDSSMFFAVISTLPSGAYGTTLDLNVRYLRPIPVDAPTVRCEARTLRRGRRIGLAEATVVDSDGNLCAHGTSNVMIEGLSAAG